MFSYLNPMLLADFYKLSHRRMYPEGTEYVYSTWTPRASRRTDIDKVVVFGHQAFIQQFLIGYFNKHFFGKHLEEILDDYHRTVRLTLGVKDPEVEHIKDLHSLGYLPLSIKSLPEGSVVPLRTPVMTIENTDPRFFWLTNYIESLASCELWQASTSATLSNRYRQILEKYSMQTVGHIGFVPFQGHDFSMRGMSSLSSAINSGMGHLLSFVGTDTIPAIQALETFYEADLEQLVGTSIPASEHSIQCAYGNDLEYLERLISVVHPEGFVSIVSDGYDFWDVMSRVLPLLKDKILARHGKVVIRPDSGDPVKIVCGDPYANEPLERGGAVQSLWDTFGGTINSKGYRELHPNIGLIYGDAINIERAETILKQLEAKGFASTNVVFGIGSYTYQYNTRDTFGYALKSTLCVINGEEKHIFKCPKTDDGIKKSQKGRVQVTRMSDGGYSTSDQWKIHEDLPRDLFQEIFLNGVLMKRDTLATIRERLRSHDNG